MLPFTVLFHFLDPRIAESSGVAADRGIVFTHNDSGDSARFFAVDGHTGRTLATYAVAGATNVDWEDVARTPAAGGRPASLWFADIGDNAGTRASVTVYRVDEPRVSAGTHPVAGTALRFRYPDGPHDAETLLVDPRTGRIAIVTKSYLGTALLFAAPAHPSTTAVTTLAHVGTLHLGLGNPATGGAVTGDGAEVAIRTYTSAFLYDAHGRDVVAALRGRPTEVQLPRQPQGEGIAFTGRTRAVLTSEGKGAAVLAVTLPSLTAGPATSPSAAAKSAAAKSAAAGATHGGGSLVAWSVAGAVAVLLAGAGVALARANGAPRR